MFNPAKYLMTGVLFLSLTACAPSSPYIMPPLKYQGKAVHLPQNAYLYWQRGQVQAGDTPSYHGEGVGGLVASMIEAEDRKNNPSKYHLTYGKAQQAAFITNFRDVLVDHRVFKHVEIITNPAQAKADGVLMTINFKSTRVSGFERNYKITLTVEMKIKSKQSTFTRTYLTESDEGSLFNGKSYNEQTTDASQQMINQLMKGINQWAS
jgi:hypothetical protein